MERDECTRIYTAVRSPLSVRERAVCFITARSLREPSVNRPLTCTLNIDWLPRKYFFGTIAPGLNSVAVIREKQKLQRNDIVIKFAYVHK